MKSFLFFVIVLLLGGCAGTPTPTPVLIQQYPATWTPAPTPTNTPPGPTATLVIQRTAGPLPTRDPNARVLPNVTRGSVGLWADVTDETAQALEPIAGRARVLVSQNPFSKWRKRNQFLFLQTTDAPDTAALPPEVNGIVFAGDTALTPNDLNTLRESLAPRFILARSFVTDTARLQELISSADGVLLQNFLRPADAPLEQFPSEDAWKQDVETLANLSIKNDALLLTALEIPETDAQSIPLVKQWVKYALASYLLAANNTHTFFGVTGAPQSNLLIPEMEWELGAPMTGVYKQNGVYQRRFIKGLVLVNPTNDLHAFYLPRNYRDANGFVITQIEMPPHTAEILELAE